MTNDHSPSDEALQAAWEKRCAILFNAWVQLRYHRKRERFFDLADKENIAPQYAADRIAEARMTAIGKLKLPLGRTAPRFMGHLRG